MPKMPRWAAFLVAVCLMVPFSLMAMPQVTHAATYPCLFYGTATVDDEPVAAGTEITAWVESQQVASTTTGAEGLDPNQYTLPVELAETAEVSFKIGDLDAAETATWAQYGSMEVNLTAGTPEVVLYPCLFYGTATVDDEPVAAGTEVTAWAGSEQVASTTTGVEGLAADQYSLPVELAAAAEVSFKIGELNAAETANWIQEGSVEVNLTAATGVEATYPCLFYGTAMVDDEPVGSGTEVTAWAGSEQVGSTTTGAEGLTANQYSLPVELAAAAEVSFKVGTLDATETATWVQYGSVEVNLTAATGLEATYPCLFYGTATVDDEPVAAGTEVTAWAGSEQVGLTTTGVEGLAADQYSLPVELAAAAEVSFKIGELNAAETATWIQYGAVEVDLTATSPSPGIVYTPPPTPEIETNLFGTEASFDTSSSGIVQETIEASNANCTLTIPEGTEALDKDGEPLTNLTAETMETPPAAPEDTVIIGLAYDFGPDGATFDPAITLTYTYDPESLTEGVSGEDLVIAFYDEAAGEWVVLDSVVDTGNNTVTASVSHFTTFALIGAVTPEIEPEPEPTPASFRTSNLTVTPDEVGIGEEVKISVLVRNSGDLSGSYILELKINSEVAETKEISLAGHGSITVPFTVTREDAGLFEVSINGLTDSFIVTAPEPLPDEVDEEVEVAEEDEEDLAPTEPLDEDEEGEEEIPAGVNWPVIVGIICGVVVAGSIGFIFVRRRRAL